MMISSKFGVIFIKNPKAASESIEAAFKAQDPNAFFGERDKGAHGHDTPAAIKNMAGKKWDTFLKVAVLRDPYDWILSLYKYTAEQRFPFASAKWVMAPNIHLNHAFRKTGVIEADDLINLYLMQKRWFRPLGSYRQVDWVLPDCFILKYEELDNHWGQLNEVLNTKIELGHINKGPWRDKRVELDKDAKKLFEILWKEDIEFYENCSFCSTKTN